MTTRGRRRATAAVYAAMALAVIPAGLRAEQTAPATPGWLEIEVAPANDRPAADEASIEAGRRVYNLRCAGCHGITGEGDGAAAPYLDPRPRDFTFANFKVRTTAFSELPLDEDLYRTITRGIPGTAMPAWAPLPAEQRWQLVYYIKHLARDFFDDEEFAPTRRDEDGTTYVVDVPEPPPATDELLERGKAAFARGKCVECHGERGLGNGTSAGKQVNYLEQRIWPRDLTKAWRYKGGSRVEDIWRTLTSGMNGTPMPSFVGALDEEDSERDGAERWALAHYVTSLIEDQPEAGGSVLVARKLESGLPGKPSDPAWEAAEEISFRLLGQVVRRPRWEIPAVDHVRVRALYDETSVAVRIEYHDRTDSTEHTDADVLEEPTTYPPLNVERFEHEEATYRDAAALQFAAKPQRGPQRPYFLYGSLDNPVNLWRFLGDRSGSEAFEEATAKGPEKIERQRDQDLSGAAEYNDGVRRVVFVRSLTTEAAKTDVQIVPGKVLPFSVMIWDGGNGESGLRQSLSPWYALRLEAAVPARAYVVGGLAALLTLLAEAMMIRRARREAGSGDGGVAS